MKQQTSTPNTIYTTLINHTNKHTNPSANTLPSRITQKHQIQRTNKNHLKRVWPTSLAQNKVTKIKKEQNRKHQYKTTHINKQTHQRNTKHPSHITNLNSTKNHNKQQNPKHIERETPPINQAPSLHLLLILSGDIKTSPKTNLNLTSKNKEKINITKKTPP